MRNEILAEVDERLYQWAEWSKKHGINLDYPRQNIIDRMLKGGIETTSLRKEKNGMKPIYMPKEIEEVEKALLAMPSYEFWDVIEEKYLHYGTDQDRVAALSKKWERTLGVPVFRQILERALYWLSGHLCEGIELEDLAI